MIEFFLSPSTGSTLNVLSFLMIIAQRVVKDRVLLSQSADYIGQIDSATDDHDELMMLKRRREDSPEHLPT